MERILRYVPVWLALVLVPLAGLAATPVAAPAALIAYTSVRGGVPSIFVTTSTGTGQGRLLIPNASWPALSTDGSKLAFVQGQNICVANFDGSGARPITNHTTAVQVAHPAFNAAGTGLVFAMKTPTTSFSIMAINLDGSGETSVTSPGLDPIFTPDGVNIVFANANTLEMMATNHMGNQIQPAPMLSQAPTSVLRFPAFSPRTPFEAFTLFQTAGAIPSICLVSFAGQRQTTVWETNALQPAFSADGTHIAFMQQGDIYMKAIAGGTVTRLTVGGNNAEPVWLK